MFSYGSGLAATLYSLKVTQDATPGSALDKIVASICDLKSRLDSRTCVAPDIFAENMKLREDTHHLGKNIKLLIYTQKPTGGLFYYQMSYML